MLGKTRRRRPKCHALRWRGVASRVLAFPANAAFRFAPPPPTQRVQRVPSWHPVRKRGRAAAGLRKCTAPQRLPFSQRTSRAGGATALSMSGVSGALVLGAPPCRGGAWSWGGTVVKS